MDVAILCQLAGIGKVGATDASGNTSGTGGDGRILGWRYVLRTKYADGGASLNKIPSEIAFCAITS